ncbi:MAG TPA: flagellar hook-basal body complex protein FliE [Kofleriaceae bacterium]
MTPIKPIALAPVELATPKAATGPDLGDAFKQVLTEASHDEKASTQAAEGFAKGDVSVGIHEVMISAEKANLSIRFATTLKNKALEAYRELMNTQV